MFVFCKKYLFYTNNTGFKNLIARVVSIFERVILSVFFRVVFL